MGSAEKKRRRELNRALGGYSYVYNGRRYPLRAGSPAADMLIEFAAPLGELLPDQRTMVALAVFSWNISLAAEAERPALIDEFVAPMFRESPQTLETVHSIVEAMVDRRIRFYAREPIYYVANEALRGGEAATPVAAAAAEQASATAPDGVAAKQPAAGAHAAAAAEPAPPEPGARHDPASAPASSAAPPSDAAAPGDPTPAP